MLTAGKSKLTQFKNSRNILVYNEVFLTCKIPGSKVLQHIQEHIFANVVFWGKKNFADKLLLFPNRCFNKKIK